MRSTGTSSRRDFCRVTAAAILARPLIGFGSERATNAPRPQVMTADESLRELVAGNERFVKGQTINPRRSPSDFSALEKGQYPHAVVIACSDSRVAPEILFDVGVGDLFVVRLAGNVIDGAGVTVKGSTEYAIAEFKAPLIVVLGHSDCGAVKAAIQHIDARDSLPGSINGLVELLKPAVIKSKSMAGDALANAIIQNVKDGVAKLQQLEPIVAPAVKAGKMKVVGGVYDLKTGRVTLTT